MLEESPAVSEEVRVPGRPRRSLAAVVLLGSVLAGYLYGWLTQLVPGVVDPASFWVGNLAAPYIALPFLAGAVAAGVGRTLVLPAASGALADAGAVAGFYELHLVGRPSGPGNPTGVDAYLQWLGNLVLGIPGGLPWLSVAVLAGAALGLLGGVWRRTPRRWWPAALVALAFVLEPPVTLTLWRSFLEWRLGAALTPYALDAPNLTIWGAEMALGLLGLVLVIRRSRRAR